jgi:streptogramin lyase
MGMFGRRVGVALQVPALACLALLALLGGAPTASAALIGEVSEFSTGITPESQPSKITEGPEGDLWFTERSNLSGNRVARITPTGEVEQFSVLPDSSPQGIALGPDGNLWFTEVNNPECGNEGCRSKVGRMKPNGSFVEFTAGITPESEPWEITAGPNESLWFTEFSQVGDRTNRIGEINSMNQHVEEFELPSPDSGQQGPFGITAGPDGNVWFTELVGNRIGRVTPSGEITEFPVPTANSEPIAITKGPDGNLWFAEKDGEKIGRINPSTHEIMEFPIPSGGGEPSAITEGPDGNLWFAEGNGDIGRITPTGTITQCSTGISGPIKGITAGPGNTLWFTEFDASRIGRITATGSGLAANCTTPSTGSTPVVTTVVTPPVVTPVATPAPDSAFTSSGVTVNSKTGAITFTETLAEAGTFSWLITFENGKFGVFTAKNVKCKKGFIKLDGKCRPSKVAFGKGSKAVAAAGVVKFTVKPSASASKALKTALKHRKGLRVSATLTFQSSRGGAPVKHAQSLTVKLKGK